MRTMITTVLFDLDDTLTDANGFAAGVLAAAAAEHGYLLPPDVIAQHPGAPYVPLLQEQLRVDIEVAQAVYAAYVAQYRARMGADLRERDGAGSLLRTLAVQGMRLGLVTNKLEALAREILGQFEWELWFGVIAGQDSCPYRKPHPGIIRYALDRLGEQAQDASFVGDSPGDMQCGRDAGIPRVIGLRGTVGELTLIEAGATVVCPDLGAARRLLLG
jgi:HAD superfamily hydrolase (TIGR01549 family)